MKDFKIRFEQRIDFALSLLKEGKIVFAKTELKQARKEMKPLWKRLQSASTKNNENRDRGMVADGKEFGV